MEEPEIPKIPEIQEVPSQGFSKPDFSRINKRNLIAFAAVFGLVGCYFLVTTFANLPVLASLQAEHMNLPGGASVYKDSEASGGLAVRLSKNVTLNGSLVLPKGETATMLTVMAHGNRCNSGFSSMSVSVDGREIINSTPMTGDVWNPYTANVDLSSGKHSIGVSAFGVTNENGCSRLLYVDAINLYGSSVTPPPTVAFSASPESVSEGSSSTLTWNSANATSCSASGGWSGSQATSGSLSTGALSSTTSYSISCSGPGGKANASATVKVVPLTQEGSVTGRPDTGSWWKPSSSSPVSWDWEIGAVPSPPFEKVNVYDIDGFESPASTVAALHNQNNKVICYIDVGSYEPGRPDLNLIPSSDIGSAVSGWPGERWLNIADIKGLSTMIQERMNMCKNKGFDAVEPDNIDGYRNDTGFPLTAAEQISYNEFVANTAHNLGLSVGLKNDVDQTSQLAPFFDWMLVEQCNKNNECSATAPFVSAGKAVFNAEYTEDGETTAKFCSTDASARINGALFDASLDGRTFEPCNLSW